MIPPQREGAEYDYTDCDLVGERFGQSPRILILSEQNVESGWGQEEVERALEREAEEKRTLFLLVCLDEAAMKIEDDWLTAIRGMRAIRNVTDWKNPAAFQKAFEELLGDLKAAHAIPPPAV